ncbi:hypothetical protein MLD38_006624 [Melastoma candidum]|uniref:Uncharacterized protein n=1 Tax=Melastoma candidum TaxID=119954 RepID=A0ACB9RMQ2_9MYRT|nr:hypothetical protein MLD38_006624 [Melastoma candidum]
MFFTRSSATASNDSPEAQIWLAQRQIFDPNELYLPEGDPSPTTVQQPADPFCLQPRRSYLHRWILQPRLRRPPHFGYPKVAAVLNPEPDPNLLSVPAFSTKRRSQHSPILRISNPDLVTANPVDTPFTLPSTPRFRAPLPSTNNGVHFNHGRHAFPLLAIGTSPQIEF